MGSHQRKTVQELQKYLWIALPIIILYQYVARHAKSSACKQ